MAKGGVAGIVLAMALVGGMARAVDPPPPDPQARRTWIAERREEAIQRREEFLKLSPEEQEKVRAERRAQRDARRQQRDESRRGVEVQGPLPLPVVQAGGEPAGESCPAGEICTLRLTPVASRVLVVTAVWSATEIECDGARAAAPPGGAVAAPWWRCERGFSVTGPGAGYLGFLAAK